MAVGAASRFDDPTTLTKVLVLFLFLCLALDALGFLSNLLEYRFINKVEEGIYQTEIALTDAAESNDNRQGVIRLSGIGVFLITCVIFALWIYRANRNARALGATGMTYTPGWSVGWYFVPFANLIKPYYAMSEIYNASEDPHGSPGGGHNSIVTRWWLMFIVANAVGSVAGQLATRASELSQFRTACVVAMVADLIAIGLDLAAIQLVNKIYGLQIGHARAPQGSPTPTPIPTVPTLP